MTTDTKKTPYKILTHDDLDGIVSALIMENILRDMGIVAIPQFTSVYHAPERLKESITRKIRVVVTDLHIPKEGLKECIGSDNKIIWHKDEPEGHLSRILRLPLIIDHHKESVEIYRHESWAYVSNKASAALLCLKVGRAVGVKFSPEMERLAFLANDYDLWIHEDPESKRLNVVQTLLGSEGAYMWLRENPKEWMFEAGERYLEEQRRRISQSLERTRIESRPGGYMIAILAHNSDMPLDVNDVNEIASELTDTNKAQCFIYLYEPTVDKFGRSRFSMSFRSRKDTNYASKMLETIRPHLKTGGGHDSACGGSIVGQKYTTAEQIIEEVIIPGFDAWVRKTTDNESLSLLGLDGATPGW